MDLCAAKSNIPLDAATTADDFIILAAAEAEQGNLGIALAYLNLADKMRPGDCAALQMRGIVYAEMEENQQAVQDLNGRADSIEILHMRYMRCMKLGHVDQALVNIIQIDTMQKSLAEQCSQSLGAFLASCSAKPNKTAAQMKHLGHV